MSRLSLLLGVSVVCLSVAACANKEYHYWQKIDPTTAIYLTGPKAQQMLEQDISGCVHEIIELDKLAAVREGHGQPSTFANNFNQKAQAESLSKLPSYDVPPYIRDLRVDHKDFHDFDGCMRYEGWERVKYVGPDKEIRAHEVYDHTVDYSVRAEREAARDPSPEPSNAMEREEAELKRR